ncbi:MAG: adenylyltransferase/cytidyltransferase family protein, partial [Verrucomicrobia bacterium]|nr:adenylyltransferase/cytidyltransferase family protein [Verrucomicrobiota bacterium]
FLVSMGLCAEPFADESQHRPKRVYADIVGDLFHAGHIEFFKKAKECGDYLIICVLSDEDVESYKRVPILTLQERAAVISACRYVDEVIVAPPLRLTKEWIEEHEIDLVVHGDDFNPDMLMDQYGVSIEMGIFKAVPYTRGISTTNIINRIVERYHKQDLP